MRLVAELIPATTSGRKVERAQVHLGASLRKRGATAVDAQLLDLSTHGFRIEAVHVLSRGDYVWLKIPGLAPLDARVAWFENYTAGCEFVAPLHPAVLERVIAAANG